MKLLVVVDMQKDFVNGALGTPEARAIVDNVVNKVKQAKEEGCDIIFTLDTHEENYLQTLEGKNLPVEHCIRGTAGWKLIPELRPLTVGCRVIEKPTFGSTKLSYLAVIGDYDEIELIGLCTDICVISNALLLKAAVPEIPVKVDASCCAGVTPESHRNALNAMKMCQIGIDPSEN
ncbi:MAG: cysteine hydrolase family protein [Lachnospiraceae bacterium]